ncbi:uncharacterized protein J8A68_003945 [[Candida] subhashii]|uniref:Uncharacterized protein n=1 Tax=[Candida] subhashii TaxID=561895 RepID=A0A8J5QC85_9ASCO|nr:uncharacterized protein J8A68_003945 [[Candida] subhashii]KAG7662526.1 hypothetical protein J8A68_003945 [[Candida] subhashii]
MARLKEIINRLNTDQVRKRQTGIIELESGGRTYELQCFTVLNQEDRLLGTPYLLNEDDEEITQVIEQINHKYYEKYGQELNESEREKIIDSIVSVMTNKLQIQKLVEESDKLNKIVDNCHDKHFNQVLNDLKMEMFDEHKQSDTEFMKRIEECIVPLRDEHELHDDNNNNNKNVTELTKALAALGAVPTPNQN